jgi:hypothetical protein
MVHLSQSTVSCECPPQSHCGQWLRHLPSRMRGSVHLPFSFASGGAAFIAAISVCESDDSLAS